MSSKPEYHNYKNEYSFLCNFTVFHTLPVITYIYIQWRQKLHISTHHSYVALNLCFTDDFSHVSTSLVFSKIIVMDTSSRCQLSLYVLVWGPSPVFCRGKQLKFYNGTNEHFESLYTEYQEPTNEDRHIVVNICYLRRPSLIFDKAKQKSQFFTRFSFLIGSLIILQQRGMWEI